MIKVSHLSKRLNGQLVLDDLNLEISKGEIMAVLGPSGAGKSIFLKHLIGLMRPDEGLIAIDGVEITRLPEKELLPLRKNVGYLFQDGALFDFLTVHENLAFPLQEHTDYSEREIEKRVNEILGLVGLEGAEDKYPVELSGGMRKRAALARAVALNSKLLFCDEPTSGLDPILSFSISDLIRSIVKRLGCTTVIASHDIPNSFRIADRLAIIHEGRFIEIGTKEQLLASREAFVKEFLNKSFLQPAV